MRCAVLCCAVLCCAVLCFTVIELGLLVGRYSSPTISTLQTALPPRCPCAATPAAPAAGATSPATTAAAAWSTLEHPSPPAAPAGGEPVEVKAGDLVTFPAGMSCTWDVREAVHK